MIGVGASASRSRSVKVNGVQIGYLSWGEGPALILIPGLGENPHIFDQLALALGDRFRVIAYARRGTHPSEARPPYDAATLTGDLVALMDAIGVARAHVAGWSMGGTEATSLATAFPGRVDRIVYLDSYDLSVPEYAELTAAVPPDVLKVPAEAFASADAYRSHVIARHFYSVDVAQVDTYLRAQVSPLPDGTVRRSTPPEVEAALGATIRADRRRYKEVRAPALAIFAGWAARIPGADQGHQDRYVRALETFRSAAVGRMRRELTNVDMATVPGTHKSFFFESHVEVVGAMRRHLGAQSSDA